MRANPGGTIAPAEVIGRDELIARLWDTLERQSVILSSERRMGKTCVIDKMRAEAPEGIVPWYRDLEGLGSPEEFADAVAEGVAAFLTGARKAQRWMRKQVSGLRGLQAAGVKLPDGLLKQSWKEQLRWVFAALDEAAHDRRLVLMWDEFPQMLQNFASRGAQGELDALDLLALLREVRHTNTSVRMVFTGSMGFHHVLRRLRHTGPVADHTNDMQLVGVGPLSRECATDLAHQLLVGENLRGPRVRETADAVAELTGNVPYYIHWVVSRLALGACPSDPDAVQGVVRALLTDPDDPAHFRHFLDRITKPADGPCYYDGSEQAYALAALDAVASEEGALRSTGVWDRAATAVQDAQGPPFEAVLENLQRDHYIAMDADGRFHFQLRLVAEWWRLHRGGA